MLSNNFLDVIKESQSFDGLLLVHDELDSRVKGNSRCLPTWTSIDEIQTPKEIFDQMFRERGFNVKYVRIPISPEQAPDDQYLDEYVSVIKSTTPDQVCRDLMAVEAYIQLWNGCWENDVCYGCRDCYSTEADSRARKP
jgi:hypothetical protein